VYWSRLGEGEHTLLFLPTWSVMHSRHWKFQLPYFARHFRVLTFDGRGNGNSDRPLEAAAYTEAEFAADALAVLDATATESAAIVAFSCGILWGALLAAEHPDRVDSAAFIGPAVPLAPPLPERAIYSFSERLDTTEEWAKYNRHFWPEHYLEFLEFFTAKLFSEAHSTKQIDDSIGWGLDTTPEVLVSATEGMRLQDLGPFERLCERIRCPVFVIQGDEDRIRPLAQGAALAEATGGEFVVLEGAGHAPHLRDPVKVNLLLREFLSLREPRQPRRIARALRRSHPRALYVSSPIGLGHAQRDLAIARAMRELRPDLEVVWLAQHPVTQFLQAAGETVHPASKLMANESAHLESEMDEHDLHVFQAWRAMDEILLTNFMLFHDVVRDDRYDLWLGDEAWELDYYLHENPELKSTP
jgi:pimeloyl-ACP methyl ester carboxylesterase